MGLEASTGAGRELHAHETAAKFDTFDTPLKEMLVTFCSEWFDDEMLARVLRGSAHWSAAEVLRSAGLQSERRGLREEAETFYLSAIETSRRQGALSWELRAAVDLARLWHRTGGRRARAIKLLDDICSRAQSFGGSPLLAQARALQAALRSEPDPLQKWQKKLSPTPAAAPAPHFYP